MLTGSGLVKKLSPYAHAQARPIQQVWIQDIHDDVVLKKTRVSISIRVGNTGRLRRRSER